MEKVIPPGLNYADIKPEAIENQIRIIKYTPIATVTDAKPNDVIRFHLQGNGFFDPYSAYVRVEVDFGELPNPPANLAPLGGYYTGKFLDRSAHSLFSRLVIRSQGTELERIEEYDVLAGMINDMIYSQEQRQLHHFEGFAAKSMPSGLLLPDLDMADGYDSACATILSSHGGFIPNSSSGMDAGHFKAYLNNQAQAAPVAGAPVIEELGGSAAKYFLGAANSSVGIFQGSPIRNNLFSGVDAATGALRAGLVQAGLTEIDAAHRVYQTNSKAVFCIPLYSGILGILMPEKKFIPLSLLPLELELTVNPFGVYGVNCPDRSFKISKCEIFCHTLFFEQELHRSLEAVVAETGIFIHYNSFYLAPINTYGQALQDIAGYAQIGVYLKSINSLHWVFLYNAFQSNPRIRKLSFQSHCLTQMQVRNGMDLIPSEPLMGQMGFTCGNQYVQNGHSQFLIETYKAWNKMHDPLSDSAINQFNYNIDQIPHELVSFGEAILQQNQLGRCQYGLTLEGEELGNQKAIVTGKRSVMPFDLNFQGKKKNNSLSFMLMFLRADFIIYVRPDLVVTRLGL